MLIQKAFARLIKSRDLFGFLLHKLQPDLILDIGSRDGRDALAFRDVVPSARIIAFEANPLLAEKMRHDTNLREAAIDVRHCAVGASSGTARFFVFNQERGTGSLLPRIGNEGDSQTECSVPSQRLDQLLDLDPQTKIALWIDAEGCSYDVIEGAIGLLDKVSLIHAEVESRPFWREQKLASDVHALLAKHAFALVYERNKRGMAQANVVFLKTDLARRPETVRDILAFELRHGLRRLTTGQAEFYSRALAVSRDALLAWLAALWWLSFHLPKTFLNYYGILVLKKTGFLTLRAGRARRVTSSAARQMIRDFRSRQIAVSDRFLDAGRLRRLNDLLDGGGIREAVRRRKAEAGGDPSRDYFHLSQEPIVGGLLDRLFGEILPKEIKPMIELARGRPLRCLSVTYHETDASDPRLQVGGSVYNAHPFHIDGNPKFAKAILYLTDVDEDAGPFEMFGHSRFPLLDELLRLAYQEKHFRKGARGLTASFRRHVPVFFRRDTHLWNADLGKLQRRFPNALERATGASGSFVFFDGMNLHNGSRDQKKRREVLHFIFV